MSNKLDHIRGILFDFDFTLADSSKGVLECVNYALSNLHFRKFSEEEINKTIGLSLDHKFKMLVGNEHSNKTEEFQHYFIKRADEVMAKLTKLYTFTPKIIKLLYTNGFKLGIVSTKFRYRIEHILTRENLLRFFEVIVGGEDVQKLKPNPFGLCLAIKKLNLDLSNVIYVGDSVTDSETAYNAGVSFIASLSGVTPKEKFKQSQVKFFIEDLSSLPTILAIN